MQEVYACAAAQRGFSLDEAQRHALHHLQRLRDALLDKDQRFFLHRLLGKKQPVKGVYLWGGVGRGKSFLMDVFFAAMPLEQKRRVHFHRFMQEIHAELDVIGRHANPLAIVALRLSRQARLFCLDEFHVSDIADAMLLSKLLGELFKRGVVLVTTSNQEPDELYLHGLQRTHFLPTIALIKQQMDIVEVDGAIDFRLRTLEKAKTYHVPLNEASETSLGNAFYSLAGEEGESNALLEIEHREVEAKRLAAGLAWFDFPALCEGPRGQADYIEIARRFHTVLISGIPLFGPERAPAARRFAWLVDEFYDRRVKLMVSAAASPGELYGNGADTGEFARTASRLVEMQSTQYLAQPHLP